MGVFRNFCAVLKKKGFNKAVKETLRYLVGIEDEIATLHYVLNRLVDIREFPKAEGALGELQEADTVLLRIFHAACEKLNITYWIDYGTFLGGIRHGGFLPWDDDVDVSMEREQYDRAFPLLKDELGKYGIIVRKDSGHIGIGYKHSTTGVWMDVFPVDAVKVKGGTAESSAIIERNFEKLRKYCKRNGAKINDESFLEKEDRKRQAMISKISKDDGKEVLVHGVETFLIYKKYCDRDLVFPLQKISFEGNELWAPSQTDKYLCHLYGGDYMSFPRTGVEHHDGGSGIQVSQWSVVHNINMKDIKDELLQILEQITERDVHA